MFIIRHYDSRQYDTLEYNMLQYDNECSLKNQCLLWV